MAFQQGLSGLNAASRGLDVIGHNIANANTVGMKSGRAEFSEIFAASVGAAGGISEGLGAEVAVVSQDFSQGNLTITGNSLDLAINGQGFFQVQQADGSIAYTRAGQFKLDRDGRVVTNNGAQLMGYQTDTLGTPTSSDFVPLSLPTSAPISAKQTTEIVSEFNLDARAPIAATATPPTPITTYGTSIVTYDSQGVEVPVSLYFSKTAADTWDVYNDPAGAPLFALTFDTTGKIVLPTTPSPLTISVTSPNPNIGAFNVTLDVENVTQYGTRFAVSDLTQDGYTAGELTGLNIEESGVITARYSNGQTQAAGMVGLANFRNLQGLAPQGGSFWSESFASGQPVRGSPAQGKFGSIRAGALEDSNVDLTAELVNMMTAQRTYQANAQTIRTQDQVLSTLVSLK